ncbi:chloride channel protein [Streptococcus halichoeri]|uniref:chloride channel protein n=1 Tax=Streptococcus halichoeri TaxID=254785 RepID=UPI00135902BB|nr:chloride channel protein [Streptococcus halichoeri]
MLKSLQHLQDQTLAQIGVLSVAAIGIGLLVGSFTALFGRVLLAISAYRTNHIFALLPFLALAGLAIIFIYQRFGGKSKKGLSLVFEVGQGKEPGLPLRLVPLVMVTTWLTHLFGGSAGREGVAVQIGATLSHYLHRYFPGIKSGRSFLMMGMAAGFAGLFQTPMAATFFALEVLVLDQLCLQSLFPTSIAAFTAALTSHGLGLEKFVWPLPATLTITPLMLGKLVILGLCFGIVGNLFAYLLAQAKSFLAKKLSNPYLRIASVGCLLSLLLMLCHLGRYSGLGTNLIDAALSGGPIYSYDWLLKLIFTVITIAAGFQGGEVTPLFAIGASLGVLLAPHLGLPVVLVAALGYTAVFGSATNTVVTPIIIGYEVFGPHQLPAFFLVCVVAYVVDRRQTIYGLQEIAVPLKEEL